MRPTAWRKVSWPFIRITPSLRRATIRSASSPSEPRRTGPTRPGAGAATTTAAPAPSASRAAVERSSGSVRRLRRSAPTTRTASARSASTWATARARALRKPVHAAPTSKAPVARAPISAATSGARLGVRSSGAIVAAITSPKSPAASPARSTASAAARAASSLSRSPSPARRRSRTPVRLTIHSSLTPRRSAMGALATTRSGSAMPTAATAAPRSARELRRARGAGRTSSMGGLQLGQRERLAARKRPPGEALQHLPGPDVHEGLDARAAKRRQRLAPAHRPRKRGRELAPQVLRRRSGPRAREERHARAPEGDALEKGPERADGRRHRCGVEGALDAQAHAANAACRRLGLGAVHGLRRPREHELTRRVVVRHREPPVARKGGGELGHDLALAEESDHRPPGPARRSFLHERTALGGDPDRVLGREGAGGGE